MPSDNAAPPLPPARLLALTARIVSAHASRNQVASDQLAELITTVHRALGGLGQAKPARLEPAVPIRRSVRPDRLVCLECGAVFKMLKRHLRTEHHLTPEGYRERRGLRRDYPMIAPDYAEMRSGLATQFGLGRKRVERAEEAPDVPTAAPGTVEAGSLAKSEKPDAPPLARGRGRRRARNASAG